MCNTALHTKAFGTNHQNVSALTERRLLDAPDAQRYRKHYRSRRSGVEIHFLVDNYGV